MRARRAANGQRQRGAARQCRKADEDPTEAGTIRKKGPQSQTHLHGNAGSEGGQAHEYLGLEHTAHPANSFRPWRRHPHEANLGARTSTLRSALVTSEKFQQRCCPRSPNSTTTEYLRHQPQQLREDIRVETLKKARTVAEAFSTGLLTSGSIKSTRWP
mgnify:CR=1 FL=1